MAQANRELLARFLSEAFEQNSNLLPHIFIEAISTWISRKKLRITTADNEQDMQDIAGYIASLYDILNKDSQIEFIYLLNNINNNIYWERALNADLRQHNNEFGDYQISAGPDLLPDVTIDKFRNILLLALKGRSNLHHKRIRILDREITEEISEDPIRRKVLFWSLQLFIELSERSIEIAKQIPSFWQFAVGFFNPYTEGDGFGVIALTMGDGENLEQLPQFINIGKNSFPFLVRNITIEEHTAPKQHLLNGTAGCWARSRINSSNSKLGVLTAKHVTGMRNGTTVNFSNGNGRLIDVAPEGIDAALVKSPELFSQVSMKPLKAVRLIAPWTSVEFTGAVTGSHSTLVTATTDQLGILNSPLFPVRVLLDKYGDQGDSGALVKVKKGTTNEAVGLYLGKFVDLTGRSGGLAQHMEQIVEIMDMELYQ